MRIEDLYGGLAPKPVTLVRALEVVEAQVAVETALHRSYGGLKGPSERAAPELDGRTKPRHAWTNGFVERQQGTILPDEPKVDVLRYSA